MLFSIGSFLDLQISITLSVLMNNNSFIKLIAYSMTYLGDIAPFLIILFLIAILVNCLVFKFNPGYKNFLIAFVQFLFYLIFVLTCTSSLWLFHDLQSGEKVYYFTALGINLILGFAVQLVIILKLNNYQKCQKFMTPVFKAITFLIILGLAILILKYSFGRPRFRDLQSDYSDFKNWYENIFSSQNRGTSFPSGHMGMVCFYLSLKWFLKPLKWQDNYQEKILTALFWLMIFLMGFARIVIKAHFLTDVVMTPIIALLVFWVSDIIVEKIKEVNFKAEVINE
ncbi:phosphatase PAP2 family protein [Spiroplasma endosymbiont of Panorpa germanica]|uniref:phosphatase PAP2 family protein n=1 Tax=Spiroplasma endosymbiont of Panorpa germanica TaxID=3066314 RepID=UPI0030D51B93